MDINSSATIAVSFMLVFLLLGVPIVYSLGFTAITLGVVAFGGLSLDKIGWTTFQLLYNTAWTPLPLFTLMASIIAQTKIGEDLYRAARSWLAAIPGGVVAASIAGEGIMAAALGASAPALLVVGKVVEPELRKLNYNMGFSVGAMLCGGVLGPLIPPSAVAVIYSVLTNVALGRLLIAGVIPGLLLAGMLILVTVTMCAKDPSLGAPAERVSLREKIISLKGIWAVVLVMLSILGSIYAGIATPTEAAGVGTVVLMIIAFFGYGLRAGGFYKALLEAATLNAVLMFTVIGATLFTYVVGSSALAEQMSTMVTTMGLPPIMLVVAIMILLLILGFFFDGMTIMLLTVPIFAPVVTGLGFDAIWLGILYMVNCEIGLLTPPMAINFFLARTVFKITTRELFRGMVPFLITLVVFLFLLLAFPEIALWLPNTMTGR